MCVVSNGTMRAIDFVHFPLVHYEHEKCITRIVIALFNVTLLHACMNSSRIRHLVDALPSTMFSRQRSIANRLRPFQRLAADVPQDASGQRASEMSEPQLSRRSSQQV